MFATNLPVGRFRPSAYRQQVSRNADYRKFDDGLKMTLDSDAQTEARMRGAQLVTTEKDAARLPRDFRPRVMALPVRLALQDPALLDTALTRLFPG